MHNFKEWLSDNLRYIIIGGGILAIFAIIAAGVGIHRHLTGNTGVPVISETEGGSETDSETESETEPETQSESATESETETDSETETESEDESEPESETQRESGAQAGESEESGPNGTDAQTGESQGSGDPNGTDAQTGESQGSRDPSGTGGQTDDSQTGQSETGAVSEPVTEAPIQTEAPAQTEPVYTPTYLTVIEACYLRSGPGYEYDIITTLEPGQVVEYLDGSGRYHVRTSSGLEGYTGTRFYG